MKHYVGLVISLLISGSLLGQEVPESSLDSAFTFLDSSSVNILVRVSELEYDSGLIVLGDNLANLEVPKGYKYLNPADSRFVLEDVWGNPPSPNTMGLLFPANQSPLSDSGAYAIEIFFEGEGYVEDEDAEDLDYAEILEEMQTDTEAANQYREAQGYEPIQLVGWAAPPHYDAAEKKLYWAKDLVFGDSEIHTLNYNIRILGRRGYLVLNAIGSMDVLEKVEAETPAILASVSFKDGHRYSDFDPSIDQVAAVGVGGLIAGKVLAKTGLLAVLAKFGKFIIVGIIAAFAFLRKMIFGSKEEKS
ncbi:MAG: DUF2167 domain-containing protein [Bacteroidota bacterium]